MKRSIGSMLLFLILIGCGVESEFDRLMRSAKEELKSGKFEAAVKQFDLALIEKPNDKDAEALFNRATNSLHMQKDEKARIEKEDKEKEAIAKAHQILKNYKNSTIELATEIKSLIESIDIKKLTKADAITFSKTLDELNTRYQEMVANTIANKDIAFMQDKLWRSIAMLGSVLIHARNNDGWLSESSYYEALKEINDWFQAAEKV